LHIFVHYTFYVAKKLKCSNLLVLTHDFEATEKTEWFGIKNTIEFKPAWKWLLESK
jgi:predicted AAA+ superfamily ATPase